LSNVFQRILKNKAGELRKDLKDFVFDNEVFSLRKIHNISLYRKDVLFMKIRRGQLVWVNFEKENGSCQSGKRPAVNYN